MSWPSDGSHAAASGGWNHSKSFLYGSSDSSCLLAFTPGSTGCYSRSPRAGGRQWVCLESGQCVCVGEEGDRRTSLEDGGSWEWLPLTQVRELAPLPHQRAPPVKWGFGSKTSPVSRPTGGFKLAAVSHVIVLSDAPCTLHSQHQAASYWCALISSKRHPLKWALLPQQMDSIGPPV